jgi:hypothetical protein
MEGFRERRASREGENISPPALHLGKVAHHSGEPVSALFAGLLEPEKAPRRGREGQGKEKRRRLVESGKVGEVDERR